MKKVKPFGLSWTEFICIIVAVIVAEMATNHIKGENWFIDLIIFFVGWFIGYTLCFYMIKYIKKWTEKN